MGKTSQRGFTLIEILIAIGIFMVVMTGIYSVYQSQNRSYLIQEQVAAMQQNLRAGMFMLSRDARNAGCMIDLNNMGDGDITQIASMEGIEAFNDFEGAGPDRVDFLYASFRDATWVRDGMPKTSAELKVIDPSGFEDGSIAIISGPAGPSGEICSNIMEITHVQESSSMLQHNPGQSEMNLNLPGNDNFPDGGYPEGSWIYKGKYLAYKIGYLAEDTAKLHPQLQVDLDGPGSKYGFQPIAENIEDMQVKYILEDGTETDQPATTEQYDKVRAMRITLVARSDREYIWYSGEKMSVEDHDNTGEDHYIRRSYTTVVDLRNKGIKD